MKFLWIFGLFSLILGFAFNGAFAATSSTTGFGTPDDPICDNNGCWYCDENDVCSFCPVATEENPTPECRMLCAAGDYGDGTEPCQKCTAADSNYPNSMQSFNRVAGSCFKLCDSSCNEYNNWASYFGSNAGNFTYERFYPKEAKQLEFKMLQGNNCNMGTNYCTYSIYCAEDYANACKPGHVAVTFKDANNNILSTLYTVHRAAWSTQNTQGGMQHFYSGVTYPTFVTPTAPTISGKRFIGWYDALTGGTMRIAPASNGALYGNLTFDLANTYVGGTPRTLYAQYEDIITAIQLLPNGGTPTTTYTIYYKNGTYYCDAAATSTPITSSHNIFTRCNFTKPNSGTSTFNGYYSATSGGTQYTDADGKLLSAAYANVGIGESSGSRWYAQYESTCESTILLEVNGGSFTGTCPSEFHPTQSGGQWLSPTLNSGCLPTRPGYTFMGYVWTNGIRYYDANLNPINTIWPLCNQDKVILEAQWEGNCNLITFDDNNVTGTNVNANNTQRKRSGATDWLDADPTNANACGKPTTTNPVANIPTNANATFLGYYTARDSGGIQIFNASGTTTAAGNNWTISQASTLYARWQCDTNYVWNATTHTCEQNTASVTYKCYVGDSGKIDNEVTLTNYAVRSLSWYSACNINNNNPVPNYKWRFSGTNTDYNAGDIIPSWTYGNDKTFTPAYTATFNCNNDYWQTPTGGSAPAAQSVLLGGELIMPNMPCEVKPEYDGWLETNYTWETSYTQNLTSPVPGAQCLISSSDLHYGPGDNFPWKCPTDLTFEPLTKFINKPITVSCGLGGTSQTFTMTFENQSTIEQDIIDFFNSCGGSCPLDNPSGPHGYNRKVVCATGLENQNLPTTWERIENDTQGRTCYKTPAGTNVQSILNEISLAQITDLDISNITHCPQRVTYKCSEDATDVYDNAPYAVFEREYTTQTPETVGCESGLAFNNWKNLSDNQTFTAGQLVSEWPYEDPVTLVAQWGGANTYNVTYANMANATGSQTGMPTTYTYGTGATIDGVPTREHSIFIGWCTESTLTNCAPTQTISPTDTGDKTFWANWECEHPYHIGPETGLCEACPDGQYWDGTQCVGCSAAFPNSTAPFNWSEAQCWRNCPNQAACQSATGLVFDSVCNITPIDSNATTQIEFKGNYEADIQTCDATNVPYCPYGLDCSAENVNMPRSIQTKFWYGADLSNNTTRYVVGLGHWGANPGMNNGRIWSAIMGPAQQMSFSVPNDAYTFVIYPVQYAPDASVQGMTFTGYFDQQNGGTQYVADTRLLDSTNANTVATVLDSQIPGDRNLYAHYDSNDYTITYKPNYDGATEPDVTQSVTYGATFTTKPAGTFHRPGYEMSGWSEPFTQMNHQYAYNIVGDTSLNAQWEMCATGTYSGATQCTNCPDEYPLSVAGASAIEQCYKNCSVPCTTVACPANSTCTQTNTMYDGTEYYGGTCNAVPQNCEITEIICDAGFYLNGTVCEPCPEDYSSAPGSVGLDACFLAACPTGQHIAHGACEYDVIGCDAPYAATATRIWNPTLGAYGSCQIQECEDGYHVASNACVPNDQLCNVANGRGERAWNGTQWGNCVVTECDPGFEPNASNTACGRCGNYMGADGQPAVSSYIAGCEIATCMYQGQKYALENGECRPICETASDDTGSKHWDNATKKCVRTCNPGYKMW